MRHDPKRRIPFLDSLNTSPIRTSTRCGRIIVYDAGGLLREEVRLEKRILLVEDNARFREDFARVLKRALAPESLEVTFLALRIPQDYEPCGSMLVSR